MNGWIWFTLILYWTVQAIYCGLLAEKKGYEDKIKYYLLGFLFGMFTLLYVIGLPDLNMLKKQEAIIEKLDRINLSHKNETPRMESSITKNNVINTKKEETFTNIKYEISGMEIDEEETYKRALGLYDIQNYDLALETLQKIESFKDSKKYIELCKEKINKKLYFKATTAYRMGEFDTAKKYFVELGNYKDSEKRLSEFE